MTFHDPRPPRRRIAIVGSGISGLSAAYYLSPDHDVTLYEADTRLGGHARTVVAGLNGDQPVDTGFIVFNYATYPHLTRLFDELGVPVTKSDMSFSASIDGGRIEYGLTNLRTLTAQRRNLLRPGYYRMMSDIMRFGREAEAAARDDEMTIGELVRDLKMGRWFSDNFLMPMCGAIWSTPLREVDQFPAQSLVRFFRNHALFAQTPDHQWWTVRGGSVEYVRRLKDALTVRGCRILTGTPVHEVRRGPEGVVVKAGEGARSERFDEIVFACHSDQALRILGDQASVEERSALGDIRYQTNRAVLHRDPSQMPKRRACWASWAYRSQDGAIGVTYWMNKLQNIPESDPLFVTLNPSSEIAPDMIYDSVDFAHPMFDRAALSAQTRIGAMQGQQNTWFAGAYLGNGFHEDGIASAVKVVDRIRALHPLQSASPELRPDLAAE
ncbi:NAD(P)/FAD-dependent oxidoreductase [Oceanicola sp. 22II-s10i]|uniref:NAD(P)/FAD-dependent oxidoreductase n=1 Tax=Oceanicola sp. 22II-s10i TaxID=1317116 RepID=UPI000B526EE1|nr:FAD-dependent oxidoreductase [Oceanicola sp. 22II-s10i]